MSEEAEKEDTNVVEEEEEALAALNEEFDDDGGTAAEAATPEQEAAANPDAPNEATEEKPTEQAEGEAAVEKKNSHESEDLEDVSVGDASAQKGGDSSQEKVPAFEAINPKSRESVHDKLRAYENRRRTSFQSKLESSSLYWRSFRDLLQSSVHETARAERLVLGTAKAHLAYADAMQASFEDGFLDDRGNVVLDQKRQKRLADQRVEGGMTPKTSKTIMFTAEERKANMLTTIMEAQLALAKKFGENARELEEEIASEVTNLRVELQEKVSGINTLGDVILAELDKTEAEVSEAWENYYEIADKALGGTSIRAISSDDAECPPVQSKSSSTVGSTDVWLVEMQYRVAVAYQLSVWEKASTELSTLFSNMKETECQRRIDLREFLLAFTQRQERLFLDLPDVYTPPLKDLVGRDIDRNAIEEKVQFSIRKRAEKLQREEAANKKAPVPAAGRAFTGADANLSSSELESPLMSELLCKAKVIDRKLTGMMGGWKTTLAIVTADAFLHLFDLPAGRVHAGSAPEVAFQTLTPTVQVPTAETLRSGKTFFVRAWCDLLTPAVSVALDNCKITNNGTIFELVETYESKGASKMFVKTNRRRVTLRTVTEEESDDWVKALKAGHI